MLKDRDINVLKNEIIKQKMIDRLVIFSDVFSDKLTNCKTITGSNSLKKERPSICVTETEDFFGLF